MLFDTLPRDDIRLADSAVVLAGFALSDAPALLAAIDAITAAAPFRHLVTPGGHTMSVGMTNCGAYGWVSDRRGYRYSKTDPLSDKPWPALPALFTQVAQSAAQAAGFADYRPEACLINRYAPGAKLSLHQDKDEEDDQAPIVSVSLGLPAVFQFGGLARSDKIRRVELLHGDVVVWGGPSRMAYHGILPLKEGHHPATGACRINLTFRRVTQA